MKTTCPHCTQHISIDPETIAALQGQPHFACPSCQRLVTVPPLSGHRGVAPVKVTADAPIQPYEAAASVAASSAAVRTRPHRGINRNMLILGSALLLVLGGTGGILATHRSGDTQTTTQNIRNEIINNSYFQNLIASGVTSRTDLESMALIRPYGNGFIGITRETFPWPDATKLADRAGANLLNLDRIDESARGGLIHWLRRNLGLNLSAPAWVQENAQPRMLDADGVLTPDESDRPLKVLLEWNTEGRTARDGGLPEDLRNGLVLHLQCDEEILSAGVKDSSGHDNHGMASGVRWTSNGRRGGAYEFLKDGDAVVVPNNFSLNPTKLTLAAWIRTSNDDGRWHRIFDKCFDQGFALSIGGQIRGTDWRGRIHFEVAPALTQGLGGNKTDQSVNDGKWHHIVATFDGIEQRIFVDGRSASAPFVFQRELSIPGNSFDLVVGCNRSNSPPREAGFSFRGIIDEPMMWNRALSPEEVRLLFESYQ